MKFSMAVGKREEVMTVALLLLLLLLHDCWVAAVYFWSAGCSSISTTNSEQSVLIETFPRFFFFIMSTFGNCDRCIPPRFYFRLGGHYRYFPTHDPLYVAPAVQQPIIDLEQPPQPIPIADEPNNDGYEDNDEMFYDAHDNIMDNIEQIDNENQNPIPLQQPLADQHIERFDGPIPEKLVIHHNKNPPHLCRQSQSTLDGELNPESRSQFYVGQQRVHMNEVFGIPDLNLIVDGTLQTF